MSIIYITKDGDVLDQICWQYYGRIEQTLEKVLEANQHLAELGPVFTAGIKITLPKIVTEKEIEIVRLWS